MTIYDKNLKTLAHYYIGMDILIKEAKKNIESDIQIMEEISSDGSLIFKIKKDDNICYLGGKRNTTDPAKMWVESLRDLQRNAPVLMVGVGNPYYLKELVEQTKNKITIIVYEPCLQIFIKFLEKIDIEKWMEKHSIIFWIDGLTNMDMNHLRGMLSQLLTYEMLNFSRALVLPNYDVLFADQAVEFVKACRDIALFETMQFNTRDVFSNVIVKNLFYNARYLCDGYKITQLATIIPKNIPGIVVAAGPSLDKNIRELKRAKGKAFIIAVDTAIKPLLREGIIPDMFAIIDGLKPLELVKIKEAREIPLATTLNAAMEILDYHTGKKFFSNEGFQFAEEIFTHSGHPAVYITGGGSVATNAFSILHKIGLNTIILVGQDLAYTNNKSHADGTFREKMEEQDTTNFIMVEGNYEEKVPTLVNLKLYLAWYNDYIAGCKKHNKNFRVINATEGGAKIENTEIMTLKDAIDRECTEHINIDECLKKLSPMLDDEKRLWAVKYLTGLKDEFLKMKKNANEIRRLYQKLDKLCNRRNIDKKEYLSILNKLNKKIKTIDAMPTYQLVKLSLNNAQYILWNEQFMQADSLQKEGKEISRKGILYMENVEKIAELFKQLAEEVFTEESLERKS